MFTRIRERMDLRYMGGVDYEALRIKVTQRTPHSHYRSERFCLSVPLGPKKLSFSFTQNIDILDLLRCEK